MWKSNIFKSVSVEIQVSHQLKINFKNNLYRRILFTLQNRFRNNELNQNLILIVLFGVIVENISVGRLIVFREAG